MAGKLILVSSGFGLKSQVPFVSIESEDLDKPLQISPDDARKLAMNLLQAAEAADTDAFLVNFLKDSLDPQELNLVPKILYGCAMRINECLRLRIKDVDLNLEKFSIHEAKGDKERIVPIPKSLIPLVKVQYDKAVADWKIDVYHKFNGVNCGGVEKKYPSYPMSKEWYWLFPAANLSSHPKTHVPMMRHHVMDYTIQRIFEDIRSRCDLPVYTTPHILRHACLTHMAADMIQKGFTETMITAELKKLSGHVKDETLWGYIHLAVPRNAYVVSPIEGLV